MYSTVSIPGVTPVSRPEEEIVAREFVTLHVPPGADATIVVNVPAHNMPTPVIAPAVAAALTVIG